MFNKGICITTVICIVVLSFEYSIHFAVNSVAIQMHHFESEDVSACHLVIMA